MSAPIAYLVAFGRMRKAARLMKAKPPRPWNALKTSSRRMGGRDTRGSRSSPQALLAETITVASTMRSTKSASAARRPKTLAGLPERRPARVQRKLLGDNARKLYGIEPLVAVKERIESYEPAILKW